MSVTDRDYETRTAKWLEILRANLSPSINKGYKDEWVVSFSTDYSQVHTNDDIVKWCYDTMGEPGRNRRYRWRMKWSDRSSIFIRNEQDLLMFRLRWC